MKISENGIRLIKQLEGLRLKAYLCSSNIWTIGWGTTQINGTKVKAEDQINLEHADLLFKQDLKKFENLVNSKIQIQITQNQFDALVSHSYNTGGSDTLFQLINQHAERSKIKFWFENTYIMSKGKIIQGLVERRKKEANLFFLDDAR
jgi:lysozyme